MADYVSHIIKTGLGGLNLTSPIDQLEPNEYSRLTNVMPLSGGAGGITTRRGMTAYTAAVGTSHHSVKRFSDLTTIRRIFGIDGNLYYANGALMTLIDTGYSGNPLVLLPHKVPFSGESWMLVADSGRMRKVRLSDGLDLPLGLTQPGAAPAVAVSGAAGDLEGDYDWKYVHFDTRTGATSNPSPESAQLTVSGNQVNITPIAYGDASIRQLFYRRGGTLPDDWYFSGQNASDGGVYNDSLSDLDIAAAGAVEDDNDAPVTTANSSGVTVKGANLSAVFGPVSELIFGCGDQYRPGHLYWCKPGSPDMWPADNTFEVTTATEPLLNGVVWGGQAYVWSTRRMFAIYPNPDDVTLTTVVPSGAARGLAGNWAFCLGPNGIYAVDQHGLYQTNGADVVDISTEKLAPLFRGETVNGYHPVDWAWYGYIRLAVHRNDLWVTYKDTTGAVNTIVLDLLTKLFRIYQFNGISPVCLSAETEKGEDPQLFIGTVNGRTFTYSGTTDNGAAISAQVRTGSLDGGVPRVLKTLGDFVTDVDRNSVVLSVVPYLNYETASLTASTLNTGTGITHSIIDPFGVTPQQARNVAFDMSWSTSTVGPYIYDIGYSFIPLPELTVKRPTDWEDLGTPACKYLKGLAMTVETDGEKTVVVEGMVEGAAASTIATFTVNSTERTIITQTWPVVRANLFRLRPTDTVAWKVFDLDWLVEKDALGRLRWEGQPTSHGVVGWQTLLDGTITLRSTADVVLQVVCMQSNGTVLTESYTLGTTSGNKVPKFVQFRAHKGVLFTYILTSAEQFWLYASDSAVRIQPWSAPEPIMTQAIGFDDAQDSKNDGVPAAV